MCTGEPRGGTSRIKDPDLNVMAMVDQEGKVIRGGGAASFGLYSRGIDRLIWVGGER
jgi:hypothetical protein